MAFKLTNLLIDGPLVTTHLSLIELENYHFDLDKLCLNFGFLVEQELFVPFFGLGGVER